MAKRGQGAGSRKGGRKPEPVYQDVVALRRAVYRRAVAIVEARWGKTIPVAEVRPYPEPRTSRIGDTLVVNGGRSGWILTL